MFGDGGDDLGGYGYFDDSSMFDSYNKSLTDTSATPSIFSRILNISSPGN